MGLTGGSLSIQMDEFLRHPPTIGQWALDTLDGLGVGKKSPCLQPVKQVQSEVFSCCLWKWGKQATGYQQLWLRRRVHTAMLAEAIPPGQRKPSGTAPYRRAVGSEREKWKNGTVVSDCFAQHALLKVFTEWGSNRWRQKKKKHRND